VTGATPRIERLAEIEKLRSDAVTLLELSTYHTLKNRFASLGSISTTHSRGCIVQALI
jgi:hypothetical protein